MLSLTYLGPFLLTKETGAGDLGFGASLGLGEVARGRLALRGGQQAPIRLTG